MSATETDWTFDGEWPFAPHFLEHPDGRLHYADEGSGAPVVLVHGNPTWGFLYRRLITPLLDIGHRVIVPDLLGFGRSDKPPDESSYCIEAHVLRLAALLESLDITTCSLVVHDWGGPIALSWASERPNSLSRLLLFNTFPPVLPGTMSGRKRNRLLRSRGVGEVLFKGADVMTRRFLFSEGLAHPERLTESVKAAYLAPHPDRRSRAGILAFPRQIPERRDEPFATLNRRVARRLRDNLGDVPVRLVWGMRDPLFGPSVIDEWQDLVGHATVGRISDAGHYLQEDAPEDAVAEVVEFFTN